MKYTASFTYCDEGINGDYDPDDPDDVALLRIDIEPMDQDGSYCTSVPYDTPQETQDKLLRLAEKLVNECAERKHNLKRVCEYLSWMDETWTEHNFAYDTWRNWMGF